MKKPLMGTAVWIIGSGDVVELASRAVSPLLKRLNPK